MYAQRDAIVRLLRDDDLRTVELVKEQLTGEGSRATEDLLDLLTVEDAVVRWQARQMLNQIDIREARMALTALCREFPAQGETPMLEKAAFLLARALLPGLDLPEAQQELDRWGRMLAKRLRKAKSTEDRVLTLSHFIGQELGFHGDGEEDYALANALLPKVIESRMGNAVALGIIYLLLGNRAGLEVEGVVLPGSFLVRHESVLIDPYERGRILTSADCAALLTRQNLPIDPDFFHATSARTIFRGILTGLYTHFLRDDKAVAALLEGWMHDLDQPSVV